MNEQDMCGDQFRSSAWPESFSGWYRMWSRGSAITARPLTGAVARRRVVKTLIFVLALLSPFTSCALAQAQAPKGPAEPMRIVLLVDEIRAIRNFPAIVAERLGY